MPTNFPAPKPTAGAAPLVRIARENVGAVILTVAIVLLWLGLVHIALAVARAGRYARAARKHMTRELDELRKWLEGQVEEMRSDVRLARQELHRFRALEVADAAVRDFGARLH
jgi:hypothetical protein